MSDKKISAIHLCEDCGVVDHIDCTNSLFIQRLLSLGICKGCPIKIEKTSVFQDPIIFNVNSSCIALRRSDAQKIIVVRN